MSDEVSSMPHRSADFAEYFSLYVRLEEDIFTQRPIKLLIFERFDAVLVFRSEKCDGQKQCIRSSHGPFVVRQKEFKWDENLDRAVPDQWKWSCFRKNESRSDIEHFRGGKTIQLARNISRQIDLANCSRSLKKIMNDYFGVDSHMNAYAEEIYVSAERVEVDGIEEMSRSSLELFGEAGMVHT